jgi:hypothetical protein
VYRGNLKESVTSQHQYEVDVQKLIKVLLLLTAVQKYILPFKAANYQIKTGILIYSVWTDRHGKAKI